MFKSAFLINLFFVFCFCSFASDSLQVDTNTIYIRQIVVTGNKVTRYSVIQRELAFNQGQTMTVDELDKKITKSRENLLNISLFNFVNINKQLIGNDMYVIIDVVERWYIFPVPIFEVVDRNFWEWWRDKNLKKANYGFYLNWENFRGRRENVKLLLRYGYSQRQGFMYSIPSIDKSQNNGLVFTALQTRMREIPYKLENNKLVYFENGNEFLRKEYIANIRFVHRQGFNKTYTFTGGYQYNIISDTLLSLNRDYFVSGHKYESYPVISFEYKDDARDIRNYPLKGYFLSLEFTKYGFGISDNDPSVTYIIAHFKKFWQLNNSWATAFSFKGKLSGNNDVPFYNQIALGYRGDLVRGYDPYVINGENFVLFKSLIKYAIIQPKSFNIPVGLPQSFTRIPYALYANLFFDAGYVRDKRFYQNNPLSNKWLYSYGAGLDFVTYYDLVLRGEFAFTGNGKSGIFLHLTAPI